MRNLLLLLLLAVLAVPVLADDWSQSFNVSGTPDVRVRATDGAIKVFSGGAAKVEASVHAVGYTRGRDYEVQVSQSGNRVDVNVHERGGRLGWFNWGSVERRSIEIRLAVPHSANLDLQTSDGAVAVQDVAGNLRVGTSDGSVEVRRVAGNVELHSGDGHVTAEEIQGSLQAHTGDGSVTVRGRFQGLNVETGDGGVDVGIDEGSVMQRGWSVRTGDGSVSVRLPASLAADLDVSTHDGHISSDFPGNKQQDGSRFQARLNNGSHLLTVRTGDGSISIRRR